VPQPVGHHVGGESQAPPAEPLIAGNSVVNLDAQRKQQDAARRMLGRSLIDEAVRAEPCVLHRSPILPEKGQP
jgi:hypothetical protein